MPSPRSDVLWYAYRGAGAREVTEVQTERAPTGCQDECCAPPSLILPRLTSPTADREALILEAFRLEWLTLGWMTVEAVVAIASGVAAGSLILLAFGLDSVIELASAGVLMWRLSVELRHGHAFSQDAERTAGRIAGGLLFALAAYVVAAALWGLWAQRAQEFSWSGFMVALIAIPAMRYGAPQDRRRGEDWQWGASGGRDGSRDMRMAIIRGCGQPRFTMGLRRMVDRQHRLACDCVALGQRRP